MVYNQYTKNRSRNIILRHAVQALTDNRNEAACLSEYYVRDIYEFFCDKNDGRDFEEVQKIDINYIKEWERQRRIEVGYKKPEELNICYLAGPEPQNDFNVLISLGVLPQNIWAFESDKDTYSIALENYNSSNFAQPKIIRMSIENFFAHTPKKFDIVYIDACGTVISNKHALRCISTLLKYHRLNSPGMLITNFAGLDKTNSSEISIYTELMARYFLTKTNPNVNINDDVSIPFAEINDVKLQEIQANIEHYYGEFITSLLCDIASVTSSSLRFANSEFWKYFISLLPPEKLYKTAHEVNLIKNNSLYKFLASNSFLKQKRFNNLLDDKFDSLLIEMGGLFPGGISILRSMQIVNEVRNCYNITPKLSESIQHLQKSQLYQFLDMPTSSLFLDLSINQLAYPMHYVSKLTKRLSYKAKDTIMYLDAMMFDECRYIYDWMPSIDQVVNSFQNLSWQYVFRFAVDGLVKQRLKYNNEYFYQGSVISKEIPQFKEQIINERIHIGG